MFVDYFQQQRIATWNPARGVWETNQMSLLCAHSVLYSATWPASGMTRNGQAYELPMPVLPTTDSESSSSPTLPTPTTQDNSGKCRDHGGDLLHEVICGCARAERKLLPTPVVNDMGANKTVERWDEWTEQAKAKHNNGNGHGASLAIETLRLLPTPQTGDGQKGMTSTPEHRQATGHQVMLSNHAPQLTQTWGKFEPAIRRWEQTIQREAPAPTKPDGKDGNHRLSAEFTEWMMGLPKGWITDCDLTRNEMLKACGNGVVPQQAKLALQILDIKL